MLFVADPKKKILQQITLPLSLFNREWMNEWIDQQHQMQCIHTHTHTSICMCNKILSYRHVYVIEKLTRPKKN